LTLRQINGFDSEMTQLGVHEVHGIYEHEPMYHKCQWQFLARGAMHFSDKPARRCTVLAICDEEGEFTWEMFVEFYEECERSWSEQGDSSTNYLRFATLIYDEEDFERIRLSVEQKYDRNETVRAMEVFERVGGMESTDFVRTMVRVKDEASLPKGFELSGDWMRATDRFPDGST
jgi:hypothetical protein